ncbi:MAG: GumC family protein [Candidatus Scalinduaceae bacterium]
MLPKKDMQEKELRLTDYVHIVQRRKWIIIALLVTSVAIATIRTFKATPVYQATTQVMIDRENPNVVAFKEVMSIDSSEKMFYQTQYRVMASRSIALRVINSLNLKDNPEFKSDEKRKSFIIRGPIRSLALWVVKALISQEKVYTSEGIKKRGVKRNDSPEFKSDEKRKSFNIRGFLSSLVRRLDSKKQSLLRKLDSKEEYRRPDKDYENSKLISSYLGKLKIRPIKDTRLVNISFEGVHPDIITTIVNKHAEEYIARNLEIRYAASRDAAEWLRNQLHEKREMVDNTENALQLYKEREKIVSLEGRQNIIVQKLEELNTTLTNARTERMGLETLYNLSKKYSEMPEMIESIPEVMKNPLIQNLKIKYVDLSSEITKLSNKYGGKFPTMVKLTSKAKGIKTKIDIEVNKIIKSIEADYKVALAKEENLSKAFEDQKKKALELNRKAIAYGTLKRESESERDLYGILLKRLKETDITGELQTSNIRIVDPAEIPRSPIRPRKQFNILLGLVIGLLLGVGVALLMEHLDHTVKSPEDVERYLGLSLLSAFGKMKAQNGNGKKAPSFDIITHEMPRSHIAEAFRNMRTNLACSSNGSRRRLRKLMLVTSTDEGEGKTFVASNLAITIAQTGKKTLIVDTDFRNPRLNKVFNVDRRLGLSGHLIEKRALSSVIKPTKVPNLSIITSGRIPDNPSELLSSDRMEKFCMAVRRKFDVVIFDTPPSIAVTDAVVLSDILEGVIFVVKYGVHEREVVERVISRIANKKYKVMGVVMNHIAVSSGGYYYPYYASYYKYAYNGHDNGKSKKTGYGYRYRGDEKSKTNAETEAEAI